MKTYKSYEDIEPMHVALDKNNYWVFINKQPAFKVKDSTDGEKFTIEHFDEPKEYNKLLSAMNKPSHLEEIIWDLIMKKNEILIFNQGNMLMTRSQKI